MTSRRWLPNPDDIEEFIIEQLSQRRSLLGPKRRGKMPVARFSCHESIRQTNPVMGTASEISEAFSRRENYSDFPIILETYRTCLRERYFLISRP